MSEPHLPRRRVSPAAFRNTRTDRNGRETLIGAVTYDYPPPANVLTLALCAKLVASFVLAAGCVWFLVSEVRGESGAVIERESGDHMRSEDY